MSRVHTWLASLLGVLANAARRLHPGQLVLLWVAGVGLVLVVSSGLTEARRSAEASREHAREAVTRWPKNDKLGRLAANLAAEQELRAEAMSRQLQILLPLVGTILFGVTWVWFGGRRHGGPEAEEKTRE